LNVFGSGKYFGIQINAAYRRRYEGIRVIAVAISCQQVI
jgi:hypothetical protein